MCLITPNLAPKKTTKDKVVYKILERSLLSPYQCFQYQWNSLYKTDIQDSDEWCSFDTVDQIYLDSKYPEWQRGTPKLTCIGKGFHSAKTIKRLNGNRSLSQREMIVKCIIPKGSIYYTEPTGCIVSNQIIIVEQVS